MPSMISTQFKALFLYFVNIAADAVIIVVHARHGVKCSSAAISSMQASKLVKA